MSFGEWLVAVLVLLLAVYGCAQLIRRVCLWAFRCPRYVACMRLAIPQHCGAMEPLFRCLQAQAAWADSHTERTLVLVSAMDEQQQRMVEKLTEENPSVTVVTTERLVALVEELQDFQKV